MMQLIVIDFLQRQNINMSMKGAVPKGRRNYIEYKSTLEQEKAIKYKVGHCFFPSSSLSFATKSLYNVNLDTVKEGF